MPRAVKLNWERSFGWSGLILLIALLGCNPKSAHVNHEDLESELRRGIGGEPASLDPGRAVDTFSYEVIRDLYEGLATESPDGKIQPGVAVSWSVNATGTQYTFQLRHDAKWSNGTNIRAQNFVDAWRRVVTPKYGSPVADLLRPISHAAAIIAGRLPPTALGVSAARDDLLVVELEQPAPYFLQLLTHSATFPIYSEASCYCHTWTELGVKWPICTCQLDSRRQLNARKKLTLLGSKKRTNQKNPILLCTG